MGKLSREERAELEARLADDDADDGEDDEVELSFPDGSSFRGAFRRAKSVAEARGFKLTPDPKPDPDAKTNVKRFSSGRRTG